MSESSTAVVRSAEHDSVSEAVIIAVADATGTDPTQLEPLYSYVDPDALDRLFSTRGGLATSDGRVEFTMDGCEVTVHASGEVVAEAEGKRVGARPS